jgi:hypothetical protein
MGHLSSRSDLLVLGHPQLWDLLLFGRHVLSGDYVGQEGEMTDQIDALCHNIRGMISEPCKAPFDEFVIDAFLAVAEELKSIKDVGKRVCTDPNKSSEPEEILNPAGPRFF